MHPTVLTIASSSTDDSMFGSPCNILSGDKRKRTICTFCVGNMKKTKIDTMPQGGVGHLGGGYPDFEESGDTCLSADLEHVSSYRIPSSRGSHVSTPAPYYYTSLEMIKEEHFNPYSVHTLPVN